MNWLRTPSIASDPQGRLLQGSKDLNTEITSVNQVLQDQFGNLTEKSVTPTPSALGTDCLKIIVDNNLKGDFAREGAAVLTEEEYNNIQLIRDERVLVSEMTRHLEEVFAGFAVVNSEMYPWLFAGVNRGLQKPDLFVCPVPYYKKKGVPENVEVELNGSNNRYGVIDHQELYDSVIPIGAKLLCTPAAFGELCIHLEHLGNKLSTPTSGMVFGRTEFWLYEQSKGDPIRFLSGEWREHGTVQAIQNFFDDTLQNFRKVDILCQALNVAPLDPRTFGSCDTGFLGQGAFGRVIRVIPGSTSSRPREQHLAALKFVQHTNDNLTQLKSEFRVLEHHSNYCNCTLIANPISEFAEVPGLCGFVLQPVGNATCTRRMIFKLKKPSLLEVLQALRSLHTHAPPLFHGDPRLPNLILTVDGQLTWIDLIRRASLYEITRLEFALDMHILVKSLIPTIFNSNNVVELQNLIISYGQKLSFDSIVEIECFLKQHMLS